MYPNIFTPKFHMNEWRFDFNPKRERWETYRTPKDWPFELWGWLHDTFGHPGTDPDSGEYSGWDYHGGWIYIYKEEVLLMFKLRWS
jgi:hypothetical protein